MPTPTPGVLDKVQRHTLMKVLGKVPERLEELDVTITRTDNIGPQNVGTSGHKERVVPFNQAASDARVELEKALRVYALRVAVVRHTTAPHSPARQAAFLYKHLPAIPDDAPSIEGIYKAIVGASDAARRAYDRPPTRTYTGECNCGARLYALAEAEQVKCRVCGLVWIVSERREWMLSEAEATMTSAVELARTLPWFGGRPVKSGTILKWYERGKLEGFTMGGRLVFRVGDVLALHRASAPDASVA